MNESSKVFIPHVKSYFSSDRQCSAKIILKISLLGFLIFFRYLYAKSGIDTELKSKVCDECNVNSESENDRLNQGSNGILTQGEKFSRKLKDDYIELSRTAYEIPKSSYALEASISLEALSEKKSDKKFGYFRRLQSIEESREIFAKPDVLMNRNSTILLHGNKTIYYEFSGNSFYMTPGLIAFDESYTYLKKIDKILRHNITKSFKITSKIEVEEKSPTLFDSEFKSGVYCKKGQNWSQNIKIIGVDQKSNEVTFTLISESAKSDQVWKMYKIDVRELDRNSLDVVKKNSQPLMHQKLICNGTSGHYTLVPNNIIKKIDEIRDFGSFRGYIEYIKFLELDPDSLIAQIDFVVESKLETKKMLKNFLTGRVWYFLAQKVFSLNIRNRSQLHGMRVSTIFNFKKVIDVHGNVVGVQYVKKALSLMLLESFKKRTSCNFVEKRALLDIPEYEVFCDNISRFDENVVSKFRLLSIPLGFLSLFSLSGSIYNFQQGRTTMMDTIDALDKLKEIGRLEGIPNAEAVNESIKGAVDKINNAVSTFKSKSIFNHMIFFGSLSSFIGVLVSSHIKSNALLKKRIKRLIDFVPLYNMDEEIVVFSFLQQ